LVLKPTRDHDDPWASDSDEDEIRPTAHRDGQSAARLVELFTTGTLRPDTVMNFPPFVVTRDGVRMSSPISGRAGRFERRLAPTGDPYRYEISTDSGIELFADGLCSQVSGTLLMVSQNQGSAGMTGLSEMLPSPVNAISRAADSNVRQSDQRGGASLALRDVVNQLPTKVMDKSMMGTDGKTECSICIDSVDTGTEVTVLPCNHPFHSKCIRRWLEEHITCPCCRRSITYRD